jgi:hypothetical protein
MNRRSLQPNLENNCNAAVIKTLEMSANMMGVPFIQADKTIVTT